MRYFFTSESVCAEHPDIICDQISGAGGRGFKGWIYARTVAYGHFGREGVPWEAVV